LIKELIAELKEQVSIVNIHYHKPDEQVVQKLSENSGWSIVQCLDHLDSDGHCNLLLIDAALKGNKKDRQQYGLQKWLAGRLFCKNHFAGSRD
jgi:hypothetical protein